MLFLLPVLLGGLPLGGGALAAGAAAAAGPGLDHGILWIGNSTGLLRGLHSLLDLDGGRHVEADGLAVGGHFRRGVFFDNISSRSSGALCDCMLPYSSVPLKFFIAEKNDPPLLLPPSSFA